MHAEYNLGTLKFLMMVIFCRCRWCLNVCCCCFHSDFSLIRLVGRWVDGWFVSSFFRFACGRAHQQHKWKIVDKRPKEFWLGASLLAKSMRFYRECETIQPNNNNNSNSSVSNSSSSIWHISVLWPTDGLQKHIRTRFCEFKLAQQTHRPKVKRNPPPPSLFVAVLFLSCVRLFACFQLTIVTNAA